MYKLQYMNVVREVATEAEKNQLILEGYELIEDIKNNEETAEDETAQEEDKNNDETENKAGKKSGKAKK